MQFDEFTTAVIGNDEPPPHILAEIEARKKEMIEQRRRLDDGSNGRRKTFGKIESNPLSIYVERPELRG